MSAVAGEAGVDDEGEEEGGAADGGEDDAREEGLALVHVQGDGAPAEAHEDAEEAVPKSSLGEGGMGCRVSRARRRRRG